MTIVCNLSLPLLLYYHYRLHILNSNIWNSKYFLSVNIMPKMENFTRHCNGSQLKWVQTKKKCTKLPSGSEYKVYMKHKGITGLDLGLTPKISHYIYTQNSKKKKIQNLKFLVLNILEKGYSNFGTFLDPLIKCFIS